MQTKRLRIGLLISIVLAVLPFLVLPLMSFFGRWNYPTFWPDSWGFQHWKLFYGSQSDIRYSLLLSFGMATCTGILATSLGFMMARSISYSAYKKPALFLSLLPVTMSPVLYATILSFYFHSGGLTGTIIGVFIAQLLLAVPFSIIYFSSFWNARVKHLEDLSATLGSKPGFTLRHVLIPFARPFLLVCFFQTFILSWLEFGLTSVIGAGQVQTLTLKVFLYIQEANPPMAALSSALLILPPAILLWFNRQYVFKQIAA